MESQRIEYKLKWNDKYLHYISGFANAQGGTLLIGVADNGEVLLLPVGYKMRVWTNKVELRNPGGLPEGFTVETLMQPHESVQRNELIAKVFFLAGFIENWGRGYEKIKAGFEAERLQMPKFEQLHGGFMTTILREKFMALNGQEIENTTQETTRAVTAVQLSANQRKVYNFIKEYDEVNDKVNDKLTTQLIATKVGVSYPTAQRIVKLLEKKRLIHRIGSDKSGHWGVIGNL